MCPHLYLLCTHTVPRTAGGGQQSLVCPIAQTQVQDSVAAIHQVRFTSATCPFVSEQILLRACLCRFRHPSDISGAYLEGWAVLLPREVGEKRRPGNPSWREGPHRSQPQRRGSSSWLRSACHPTSLCVLEPHSQYQAAAPAEAWKLVVSSARARRQSLGTVCCQLSRCSPAPAIQSLCDLGHVTSPLLASVSSTKQASLPQACWLAGF